MNIYEEALLVQDACNLSGVVHSFDKVVNEVWKEANSKGEGTDYVNKHPAVVMFVSKLASLSSCEDTDVFAAAYAACVAKSKPVCPVCQDDRGVDEHGCCLGCGTM